MKQLLITIAAVVLVGCGKSQQELNNELIRALDDGKLWRVKKAVDRGAEVNIYKTDKLSLKSGILGKAAKDRHLEIVQFLLESGADVHPENAPEGVLPIHFAAMGGDEKIVKLLIASKSDVNLADDDGNTVLHFATLWGNKKVVELLIAKGADINVLDDDGLAPMDMANYNNDSYTPNAEAAKREIADLLRKHGGKTAEELKAEGK